MPFFELADRILTHIDEVDRQHQRLVQAINDLHDSLREGVEDTARARILEELIWYANHHFKTEEALLKRHAYPKLEQHHAQHLTFKRRLEEFRQSFPSGMDHVAALEMLSFLVFWLKEHILVSDMEYVPTLKDKGVR